MENNEVTVRIIETEDGSYVAKAIGYPGVIAYGRDKEEVKEDIEAVWYAMANFNAIKNVGNKTLPIYTGKAKTEETTFRPQFAN